VKTSGFQDRFVTGIGRPLMTVFRPARPNGAAVLIAPGGGYIRVVIDKEGFEVGHRLAAAGITCFVLRYRLPAEGWDRQADVPLQDAQRAIRLIRARASTWGVDPKRICAMGFSAGGHVAASLATRHAAAVYAPIDEADRLSARPDLSALMYPVIDMAQPFAHPGSREALLGKPPERGAEALHSPQRHLDGSTPPTFLVHAWDDPSVPTENSLNYLAALRAAKVQAEAHIFAEGGHGFGIFLARGKPAAIWPELFLSWAARRDFLTGTPA
jgi:acetyl esterase/lipase